MSLLIDTAIAAESIVQAAWARAVANRERLRRRQDLQVVREATDKRLRRQPGWEDAFTNPLISNYRPDEPVAIPVARGLSSIGWISTRFEDVGGGISEFRAKVASGDGQAVAFHSYDYSAPAPSGTTNIELFSGGFIVTIFPAPNGVLVILSVVEIVDIAAPDPVPGPDEFVGPSFSSVKDVKGYFVTQTTVTNVSVPGFNLENQQTQFYNANKVNTAAELQIPDWFSDSFSPNQGSIITTPAEIGGIGTSGSLGLASPQLYLVNDAYDRSTYLSRAEFLARIEALRADQLAGFTFPDGVPVKLAASSAVPTEAPFVAGWDPVIGYDFGRSTFVATKYAQITAAPPP